MATRPSLRENEIDVPALYQTQWLPMVRLAVLLVGDTLVAEDVAQEAFLALYRNQHRVDEPRAAVAYLRASVVNLARSAIRRRVVGRRHLSAVDQGKAPGADDRVLLAEEHREVLAALGTLPDRQREVLVLRYWANVSEAEIAQTLGISPGTVKSTASRGLSALRLAMGGTR
jgi:RNA polymerase sigma-70 factor (sigma-E family)